jgi:pyruvate formate lyase activating enzyme
MKIGGLVKFSLSDYPGKASAVIFTRGCNFRCPYCHNPELVLPVSTLQSELKKYVNEIPQSEIFDFFGSRRDQLDAVVVTGGEPTMHDDLPEFLKKIKNLSADESGKFLIKLDTNGTNPKMLENLINQKLVDYIAMDIKAPLDSNSYEKIIGNSKVSRLNLDMSKIKKSADIIINSGLPHEFRTTIVKSLTSLSGLREIAKQIKGAQNYFLQKFVATKLNDPNLASETSYSDSELQKLASELASFVQNCGIR